MYKKLITIVAVSGVMLLGLAWAEAVNNAKLDKISNEIKEMLGGEAPDTVKETPIAGIYEVVIGTEVVYVSEDTQYILYGNLVDRKNRIDLTRQAKEAADKAFAVKRKAIMEEQDASKTITYKAKDEKQVLTVFTDIDCPYCVKIHNEVPKLNEKGITVRYYLFPRAGVGSPSYNKAVSAWCADDPQDALTKAKNRQQIPTKSCENPVASQYQLGQEIGVNGTPALVTESGELIAGYVPFNVLIPRLEQDKQQAAK